MCGSQAVTEVTDSWGFVAAMNSVSVGDWLFTPLFSASAHCVSCGLWQPGAFWEWQSWFVHIGTLHGKDFQKFKTVNIVSCSHGVGDNIWRNNSDSMSIW